MRVDAAAIKGDVCVGSFYLEVGFDFRFLHMRTYVWRLFRILVVKALYFVFFF